MVPCTGLQGKPLRPLIEQLTDVHSMSPCNCILAQGCKCTHHLASLWCQARGKRRPGMLLYVLLCWGTSAHTHRAMLLHSTIHQKHSRRAPPAPEAAKNPTRRLQVAARSWCRWYAGTSSLEVCIQTKLQLHCRFLRGAGVRASGT